MTPEQMLAECEKHFAAVKQAAQNNAVAWTRDTEHDAFLGVCPGYTIAVAREGDKADGAITSMGAFTIIHLTPSMAAFLYDAAAAAHN